jgi:fructoselysine 6-kinase
MIAVYGDNGIDRYVGAAPAEYVGGNAVNVAVHLADLGAQTAYFGAIGDDREGAQVLAALQSRGIDCSHVEVRHGPSAVTWIEVRGSERVVLDDNAGSQCPLTLQAEALHALARFPLVHCTAFTSWNIAWRRACPRIVEEVQTLHRAGVTVSTDFGELEEPEVAVLLGKAVQVAFVSRGEDCTLEELESALRFFHGCGAAEVIVTLGAGGAVYSGDGLRLRVPAMPIEPVDTLGAGDAFAAGWLYRRSRNRDARSCMLGGTRLAAEVCGYFGAWRNGRISSSEVEDAGTANSGTGAAGTGRREAS